MKKKIIFTLIAAVLLISLVFAGCQGGVPQVDYDTAMSQLADVQSHLAALQTDKAAVDAQLEDAQGEIAALEDQIASLKLTGATPAETAEKIVSYYHDTHIYSSYDLFVCSDMAAEVWNMLQAAGIDSIVVVGNKDTPINDILLSNHAWVLAEVAPGEYLALETTGGFTVAAGENLLYYRGWSFDSPADLTANNDLRKEYNIRVGFRNLLAGEVNNAINNQALYNKLHQLQTDQEAILADLMDGISSLASVIQ
jgi:outer membrane murein-binding lipoprotein Lpp